MAKTTPTDRYWARKVRATPALEDERTRLTITVANLERELRKAHEAGMAVGFRHGHEVGKLAKITSADHKAIDDLFDEFTIKDKP